MIRIFLDFARPAKVALGMTAVLAMLSCASKKTAGPSLAAEEYAVLNDFYQRAHLPLYHKTVSNASPGTFADLDSILSRKPYPALAGADQLKNLISPGALEELQEKLGEPEGLYFDRAQLQHIQLTGKKSRALVLSRPVVLDSIAVIRQIGITNNPVFVLKKEADGHWGLRYTFFEETDSD
jgi:hypothetical protein